MTNALHDQTRNPIIAEKLHTGLQYSGMTGISDAWGFFTG